MKFTISLLLFLSGVFCFILAFLVFKGEYRFLMIWGEISWAGAYLWVVGENYIKKIPIQTRGGLVRYEERPIAYKVSHSILFFFGLFGLVVFLLITLFGER